MTSLIGIDPGEKTGIGLYDTVTQNRDFIEVEGGYEGFLRWFDDSYPMFSSVDVVIVEKFTLRSQEFVANTTPLEIGDAQIPRTLWGNPQRHCVVHTGSA